MTAQTPDRATFCRLYYGRGASYAEMSHALGLSRAQLDNWRREAGLPSRRWLGSLPRSPRPDDDPDGPARHDILSGRLRQWRLWRRLSLAPAVLRAVAVRTVGAERYWELG